MAKNSYRSYRENANAVNVALIALLVIVNAIVFSVSPLSSCTQMRRSPEAAAPEAPPQEEPAPQEEEYPEDWEWFAPQEEPAPQAEAATAGEGAEAPAAETVTLTAAAVERIDGSGHLQLIGTPEQESLIDAVSRWLAANGFDGAKAQLTCRTDPAVSDGKDKGSVTTVYLGVNTTNRWLRCQLEGGAWSVSELKSKVAGVNDTPLTPFDADPKAVPIAQTEALRAALPECADGLRAAWEKFFADSKLAGDATSAAVDTTAVERKDKTVAFTLTVRVPVEGGGGSDVVSYSATYSTDGGTYAFKQK